MRVCRTPGFMKVIRTCESAVVGRQTARASGVSTIRSSWESTRSVAVLHKRDRVFVLRLNIESIAIDEARRLQP